MIYIKNHRNLFIFLGVIPAVFILLFVGNIYLMPNSLATPPVMVPENIEPTIYLDDITVEEILKKYQDSILENNLFPFDIAYLTEQDGSYYLGIHQDILLFINPVSFSNVSSDIVYQIGIMITSDSINYDLAKEYYKLLIKVNNEYVLDVDDYVNEVILANGDGVDNNNGLIGAYMDTDEEINFVIERKNKQ